MDQKIFLLLCILTMSIPLSFAEIVEMSRHSTGAPCLSSGSQSLVPSSESPSLQDITELTLVNSQFRVWFLAQEISSDGRSITFNADYSVESEALHNVTKWELLDTKVVLFDAEDYEWYRFGYSEGCGTLVHEYELYSAPQVVEIGIVR